MRKIFVSGSGFEWFLLIVMVFIEIQEKIFTLNQEYDWRDTQVANGGGL